MNRGKLENILLPYLTPVYPHNPDMERFWVVADKDGLVDRVLELINSRDDYIQTKNARSSAGVIRGNLAQTLDDIERGILPPLGDKSGIATTKRVFGV